MAIAIGTVTNLMGTAKATSADGSIRQLNVGDKVFQNDLINTNAAGAIEIELVDGNVMALGRDSQVLLDTEYFSVAESLAATPEAGSMDIDAIQQALLDGADPTIVAQATAAGAGAGAQQSEGGHQAVFVDYLAPETEVSAGFDTTGIVSFENNLPEFLLEDDDGLFLVDALPEASPSFVTPPPQTDLPSVGEGDNPPKTQNPENPDLPDDNEQNPNPNKPEDKGNNGVGNGSDDGQPPGNPPINDGEDSQPGNPGNPGNQGNQGNGQDESEDDPLNPEDLVEEETEALFPEDQQSEGGPKGNNGHGNGDQNAPGNSGGNNNAENSDNSGQGNSGQGQGGAPGQGMNYVDIANSVLGGQGSTGVE